MKYLILAAFLPFATGSDCNKSKPSTPSCIQQKIDVIRAQAKWNPPAEVNEYIFENKHVYLFSSPCCDQFNTLYDENCNALCAPSGGYTGRGDGKCAAFKDSAKHVRLVWKDER